MVFPSFCLNCFKPGLPICPDCQNRLSFCGRHHPKYFAFYGYAPLASLLLKKTKYRLYPKVLEVLVENIPLTYWWSLSDFLRPLSGTCLVPVPLYIEDEKIRGFNQAVIIASVLGRRLNLPINACLRKTQQTHKQAMLSTQTARRENVRGAYVLIPSSKLAYQKAVIVDDVYTSGSTMKEITQILKPQISQIMGVSLFKGG